MDKYSNDLDMGNSASVSTTSDSALQLQWSINSTPESILTESLIKKNKVKGQNSIAEFALKPHSSPISPVASSEKLSMILNFDNLLAFPVRLLNNGSESIAILIGKTPLILSATSKWGREISELVSNVATAKEEDDKQLFGSVVGPGCLPKMEQMMAEVGRL